MEPYSTPMKISPAGIALIKQFEGCRLTAYPDASSRKVPTVGYGHTGAGVMLGQRITQARADQLLANDLEVFETAVTRAVKVPLSQNQFDALVSFAFNVSGWQGSTLLKKLNAGDYAACAETFPLYCHAGEEVLPDLVRRREAERNLFNSSESA
jgi:lysozyme